VREIFRYPEEIISLSRRIAEERLWQSALSRERVSFVEFFAQQFHVHLVGWIRTVGQQTCDNCEGRILDESKNSFSRAAADCKAVLLRCGRDSEIISSGIAKNLSHTQCGTFHLN